MPTTNNKGFEVQTTGSNTGTWGTTLNDNVIQYLDDNLGGLTSKTLTNVNVTLSAAESRTAILRLTGTLTGAVQITTSCIGFFFVENLTTGAFVVTVRNSSVSTAATILQGTRQTVLSDATNGCRVLSSGFETGVKAAFYMSSAPIGWTRDATAALNNAAIRLVTTGGGDTGGTVDFTTAFSSTRITIAQANLPNINLTADSNGNHTHFNVVPGSASNALTASNSILETGNLGSNFSYGMQGQSGTPTLGLTSSNGVHAHNVPLGGSGTPISLDVKYANFLVATKD
jgi:hypothetical protein